ncbi:MAG: GntR family transcriptional regulator [Anaerovoracaceae bacterium]|nr:GntR family transcriptional regulator [Anaerovoracaceae bacterium]
MAENSLREKVFAEIMENIRSGKIKENTIITENSICEETGISRTPVREALLSLRAHGVLEKVPNRGYRVNPMGEKEKNDIYEVLAVLDGLAARLATDKLTEEDYLKMSELIDLMDISIKYRNFKNYQAQQEAFHNVYIERSGNRPLKRELDNIKNSVPHYTYYSEDEDKLFRICGFMNDEHREILRLLKEKDADKVVQYLVDTHWSTKYEDAI